MRAAFAIALLATGLAAAPVAAPAAQPARQDWTRIVTMTPSGGMRMGNPAAPVKLVEYGSMTCPHCAHFAAEGYPALVAGPIRSGRLSYEFRNLVLNPFDMAAALLARCAGPGGFFRLTDHYYRTQDGWSGRFRGMSAADYDALNALPELPRLARIAEIGGLSGDAARFGVTPERARACLADPAGVARLVSLRRLASEVDKVEGTPGFLLNGRRLDGVGSWQALQPHLKRAGA